MPPANRGRILSARWRRSGARRAVTLIELLIVITIISLLISIAIPAVQVAREAARNLSCKNNLRQLGLAVAGFETSHGQLPSAITAEVQGPLALAPKVRLRNYTIDLLPFCEQAPLAASYAMAEDFCSASNQPVLQTRLPVMLCPSAPERPELAVSSFDLSRIVELSVPDDAALAPILELVKKGYHCDRFEGAPGDYTVISAVTKRLAKDMGYASDPGNAAGPYPLSGAFPLPVANWKDFRGKALQLHFGNAVFEFSAHRRSADFGDGLGNTLLLAEDAGRPEAWTRGRRDESREPIRTAPWGHPQNLITVGVGWDRKLPPVQGQNNQDMYSFHASGANVAFADGHVVTLASDTDPRVVVAIVTPAAGDQAFVPP